MANEDTFHLGLKALIWDRTKRILLLKVNVHALKKYDGEPYWDIPGGRIQRGDTIEKALKREIQEETGVLNIASYNFFAATVSNIRIPFNDDTVGLILFAYLCEVDNVSSIFLSDEHTESGWFSPMEAAELLSVKYPPDFLSKLKELDY